MAPAWEEGWHRASKGWHGASLSGSTAPWHGHGASQDRGGSINADTETVPWGPDEVPPQGRPTEEVVPGPEPAAGDAADAAHEAVVLGSDLNGGVDEWRMTQREDGSFRVKSRGSGTPTAPIYNPNASGGFATSAIYYSDAVLTATFNATIGATDLKPELRFKYLGENGIATTLTGIALPVVATQPEPSSVLVWGGLIAACGWRWRRKNHRRR